MAAAAAPTASDAASSTRRPSPEEVAAVTKPKPAPKTASTATTPHDKSRRVGLVSFFPLALFLSTWMASGFCGPVALVLSFGWNIHYLSIAVLMYYTYRLFFKLQAWDYMHRLQRDVTCKYPYFRTQKAVLECDPIEPNSKALLSWHPHGILCLGWILNGNVGSELFSSAFRWLTAGAMFKLPLLAETLTWYRCAPVTAKVMKTQMRKGENVALLPGGFQEATLYSYGKHRVYIRKRKGFIKYALQNGYKIYPCYTFGEERTYINLPGFNRFRLWLNKFNIPTVLFVGRFFLMPDNEVDLVSVVGRPLELPLIATPTKEEINHWHGQYVSALIDLFERNKEKYAENPKAELEIKIWWHCLAARLQAPLPLLAVVICMAMAVDVMLCW